MIASIDERRLGDIPWLVLKGPRTAVFEALGEHARERVRAATGYLPEFARARRATTEGAGAAHLARVVAATHRSCAQQYDELAALARGAATALDDLLLLNLRGDLGTGDGTGCTDLAFSGAGWAFLAHNEDGAAAQDGQCCLLTLRIDGDPPVTTWWYPGFVPANTLTLTGHGLIWGIDNLTVAQPAPAPGRHFVARALQALPTPSAVAHALRTRPTAGGFAYTIGRTSSTDVLTVETAAGRAAVETTTDAPLRWHVNHPRLLPTELADATPNSLERATFLAGLAAPDEPTVGWFLDVLARRTLPHGVLRGGPGDDSATLLTVVVDLLAAQATLLRPGGQPVTASLEHLLDTPKLDTRNSTH